MMEKKNRNYLVYWGYIGIMEIEGKLLQYRV